MLQVASISRPAPVPSHAASPPAAGKELRRCVGKHAKEPPKIDPSPDHQLVEVTPLRCPGSAHSLFYALDLVLHIHVELPQAVDLVLRRIPVAAAVGLQEGRHQLAEAVRVGIQQPGPGAALSATSTAQVVTQSMRVPVHMRTCCVHALGLLSVTPARHARLT